MKMRFIETLNGTVHSPPPIWFMRQAGRHLPEYKKLRHATPDFLSFCLNPARATEATLQPIRRYRLDAAIIFSDILLVPWAMNRNLSFTTNQGPVMDKMTSIKEIETFSGIDLSLEYEAVGDAVKKTRSKLAAKTALIGFSGAPWTLMTYFFEGGSSRDFITTKSYLWQNPDKAMVCIDILTEKAIEFLLVQAKNGADALMLFDSWAGAVPTSWRDRLIYKPHQKIIEELRKNGVDLPVIGFPKAIGEGLIAYSHEVDVNCLSLDHFTDPVWANQALRPDLPIQGNLDPLSLVEGGEQMKLEIDRLRDCFANRPYIFNLGHGVLPQTPTEHVKNLIDHIRSKK